ncbi:MAG: hypothetical protein ACI91F_003526, partial [Candidatus Binatia bacterium]
MTSFKYSKPFFFCAFLATSLMLGQVGDARAAADPVVKCTQAIAKTMSGAVKKATKIGLACYKKTEGACATDDKKLVKIATSVGKKIRKKCDTEETLASAGYGPVTVGGLGSHFGASALVQGQVMVERVLGVSGS